MTRGDFDVRIRPAFDPRLQQLVVQLMIVAAATAVLAIGWMAAN